MSGLSITISTLFFSLGPSPVTINLTLSANKSSSNENRPLLSVSVSTLSNILLVGISVTLAFGTTAFRAVFLMVPAMVSPFSGRNEVVDVLV
ncbi:hypothetical protein D3C81_977350 [compost metagenome]